MKIIKKHILNVDIINMINLYKHIIIYILFINMWKLSIKYIM